MYLKLHTMTVINILCRFGSRASPAVITFPPGYSDYAKLIKFERSYLGIKPCGEHDRHPALHVNTAADMR